MKTRSCNFPAASLVLDLAIMVLRSHAAPGDVDLSFDSGSGIDGSVSTVAVQADGKLIIGGSFRTVHGLVRPRIARLNADGSGDGGFDAGTIDGGIDGTRVNSLASQADGKIIVGGTFTRINGTARHGIARVNPDGSLDSTFDPGIIAGGSSSSTGGPGRTEVNSLRLQADGKVVIAPSFSHRLHCPAQPVGRPPA